MGLRFYRLMNRKFKDDIFFILPFGNDEIERVYSEVYLPLSEEFKLNANRVDESDNGGLVQQQIFEGIQNAKIVIADISFARPNCYLEVGYALGKDLEGNLIICCKYGHIPGQEGFDNQNKIHFDLSSYNIHFWRLEDMKQFKLDIKDRLQKRISYIESRKTEVKTTEMQVSKEYLNMAFKEIRNKAVKDL